MSSLSQTAVPAGLSTAKSCIQNVLYMIKHDINTIPLLTLKTSSILHPVKIY